MTDELNLAVNDISQTMNKVKNMKTLYVHAVDWKSNTGQGVESGTVDGKCCGCQRICEFAFQVI